MWPCGLHLLKFEVRVSWIKYAKLYFCFLKYRWGNDSDLVNPKGEFEIVCFFFFCMARSYMFTTVFFLNRLKLKVNYMQELIFTFFLTKITQIFFEVTAFWVTNTYLSRLPD